jgi:hypothetical protein
MNIFKRSYMNWVAGIDVKFNPKLLETPMADLTKIFPQPERLNPEDHIAAAGKLVCDSPNNANK